MSEYWPRPKILAIHVGTAGIYIRFIHLECSCNCRQKFGMPMLVCTFERSCASLPADLRDKLTVATRGSSTPDSAH